MLSSVNHSGIVWYNGWSTDYYECWWCNVESDHDTRDSRSSLHGVGLWEVLSQWTGC